MESDEPMERKDGERWCREAEPCLPGGAACDAFRQDRDPVGTSPHGCMCGEWGEEMVSLIVSARRETHGLAELRYLFFPCLWVAARELSVGRPWLRCPKTGCTD